MKIFPTNKQTNSVVLLIQILQIMEPIALETVLAKDTGLGWYRVIALTLRYH